MGATSQRSSFGRRCTARVSTTSRPTPTRCVMPPQLLPSQIPASHRASRRAFIPACLGRLQSTDSPSSRPSSRGGLAKEALAASTAVVPSEVLGRHVRHRLDDPSQDGMVRRETDAQLAL